MHKPRIGLYYDLPYGGALRLLNELLPRLENDFEFIKLPTLTPNPNRLIRDAQNFVSTYLFAKKQKDLCSKYNLQAIFVSHDSFFAAPSILKEVSVPTLLYCQEPTRALFEKELELSHSFPLINQLYEQWYRRTKKILEIQNAQHATRILCNSRYSQKVISDVYKVVPTVVYPGIDTTKFALNQDNKKNQILIVGNDEPQKRLSLAIEAVSLLEPSQRPVLKIISPTKKISPFLVQMAKHFAVKLDLAVGVSEDELIQSYQTSKLTLITALNEPFGFSAAESLSCGTPVVAVKEGGLVEIVEDGQSGVISDSTTHRIKESLQTLLTNRALANQYGAQGRKHVESNFDWSITAKKVKENLLEII